ALPIPGLVQLVDGENIFEYRITVTNHGPSQAVGVLVTDELPDALVFDSSPDGCTAQGRRITCGPLARLAADESHSWRLIVKLADDYTGNGSDITNVVGVSSSTADPDPANNTASTTGLPVTPGTADLALTKTAVLPEGKRWVSPGDTYAYRITVRNNGPATALRVQVTDPLPEVLRFVSSPDGCTATGQDVRCPRLDRLAPGASVTYTIDVQVRQQPQPPVRDAGTPPAATATTVTAVDGEQTEAGGDGGHGGGHGGNGGHGGGHGQLKEIDNIATVTSATRDPEPGNNSNRAGTTGPDGGPLYLRTVSKPHPHP
ncbi:DUF11 domain-containing protein, partial [Streptomyces clavuligerus]|uniref:DUF11 domain-containing protein n=1 Tax=Streptomyces clavuligerus TaxID=1901 RepID=UPI0018D0280C